MYRAQRHSQHIPLLLILLLLLSFSILYLATIDRAGFWLDEVSAILDLRKNFLAMINSRATAGHGPFYFSLTWPWYRLVGDSEWLMRLPALLAWLTTVGLSATLVRKYIGPWMAVLVTLLLLLNPTLVSLAQLARPYSLTILLILGALAWTLQIEDHPTPKNALILTLLSALALTTHFSAAMPVTGLLVYLLARRHPQWLLAGSIMLGTIAILPILLHLSETRTVTAPISWLWKASWKDLYGLPTKLAFGRVEDNWFSFTPLLVVVAILGGLKSGRLGRLLLLVWGIAFLVVIILITIEGSSLGSIMRYFGTATVAQTTLVGLAVGIISPNRYIVIALAMPLVLLSAWRLQTDLNSWEHQDWRAAVLYVQQHPLVYHLNP